MLKKYMSENSFTCKICWAKLSESEESVFDTRFGIDRTYGIACCAICGTEQTVPFPSSEELKGLYESYYNFGGEQGTRYTWVRERFLFSSFYRFFLALDGDISFHGRKGSGKLLDIGCNEGRGLKLYQRNGYLSEGLELNETAAEVARSQGFTVYTQTLNEFHSVDTYDVTVLSNVLEHSLDPQDMLRNTHRILKPGGQVWISCPNNRSWLRSVFGKYWINWHVPFHLVHFSSTGLKKILDGSGFSQVEVRQETPSLWVAHSIIARLFAKPGKPTKALRNPLLVISLILLIRGLLFPLLWAGNRLGRGDCLVVTARKK